MKILVAMMIGVSGMAASCGAQVAEKRAEMATMTPVFGEKKGWLGADGASSIDLKDGRVLWLFGDTFVGKMNDAGGCEEGTKMVNNTLGVQTLPREDQKEGSGVLVYHWPVRDGVAASWAASPAAKREGIEHWMWPTGGGMLIGEGDGRRLVLFFMMMRRRENTGDSVWNFQQHGVATVTVMNPGTPVTEWRTEVRALRDYEAEIDAAAEKGEGKGEGQRVRLITWGPTVIDDPDDATRALVYGVDVSDVHRKRLMLARAPRATLTKYETWEFRTNDGWSKKEADAATIADGLVDEFSVNPVKLKSGGRLMLTQIEPNMGKRVQVRFAERPEGPWSERRDVYTCPEPEQNSLFVYSAKAHPEISVDRTGEKADAPVREMVITYCVNGSDFWWMAQHVAHYRPRVIRVKMDKLEALAAEHTAS